MNLTPRTTKLLCDLWRERHAGKITVQTELEFEVSRNIYSLFASRNKVKFDFIKTTNMETVMTFAKRHGWGQFETRQDFEGYVIHCFAVNQLKEE